ncbi:hypothetical protein M9Y10_024989 [Tritrichomonas musculus]|uniref:Guanylate cyclase domain-containing protein n=1 Tax=Tritrichomonas musculus TaxID=1915356 RepID=A0ABR2HBS0_9EUKA
MYITLTQTLTIKPNSLLSVISPPQLFIFASTIFTNVFFGIGVNLSKIAQMVCFSLNIILYGLTVFSVYSFGGFIKPFVSGLILSSSITGAFFTLFDLIFLIVDKKCSLVNFFSFVIIFVLMLIICVLRSRLSQVAYIQTLDAIQMNNDLFGHIKNPNQFLLLVVCGMKFAHPSIIDLTFFHQGIERWNKNQFVFLVYTKFIAIYPEESTTLKYIFNHIKVKKLKGYTINVIRDQTKQIMKQREAGLTSELRKKLNQIKKQNQSAKHKLGHVWDVVIRRNLGEIEIATKRALTAMNQTFADFNHLLREFPNNRNVTHFYGIFLKEVMADYSLAKEMSDRTKALLPGITILEDQTHDYGLKAFPNLPNSIKGQKEVVPIASTLEAVQLIQNSSDLDKEYQNDLDELAGIKRNIENMTIPAICGSKIFDMVLSLIFLVLPCIAGLIYVNFYIKKLTKPLEFIDSLSLLRTYAYQVIGFSLRYVGESLSILPLIEEHEKPPNSFGGSWDTKTQLKYLLTKTTDAIQEFGNFRMFEEGNHLINQAQNLIFQNTVSYNYYLSPTNYTTSNISIQAAILDFTIQQRMILDAYEITPAILSSGTILNPLNNVYPIITNINTAFEYMISYINENNDKIHKIAKIVLVVLVIVLSVLPSLALFIEVKWINSNKIEIYQCLFSLPKKVVSELAENRDSKSKENKNEEINKQDENILKIFNSGGSDESLSDMILMVIGTVFISLVLVINVILFYFLITDLSKIVKDMAPHLNYLQGSYAMLLSSINWLNVILFENSGYQIPTTSFDVSLSKIQITINRSHEFYHYACCGGSEEDQVPFRGFTEGVNKASQIAGRNCLSSPNKTRNLNMLIKSSFTSLKKTLECLPVDMTYILIDPIIFYSISPFQKGKVDSLDFLKETYGEIWMKLISPLYEHFFEPLHETIIPTIDQELNDKKYQFVLPISVLLVLGFLFEVIFFIQIFANEKHIKSVLKLLLHCKPSVVFSSNKIMQTLSGDFSSQQNDTLTSNTEFFDTVFTSLPDAIMYANNEMIIQSANNACQHTFGDVDLIGKSIKEFFLSNEFIGNVANLFTSVNSNPTEEITYKKDSNSETILQATSMMANGKFVVSCRNVTQSHRYNTLIFEEKQNSDKLLSTILPPSLVERVQEGEKNISFSVQSASILFSDIVNFTPWCGSLPAEKVMSTLNILFKRFDSILETKPTMTKIKCIGDCYMAAGGIFAELNQPAVHAKEVVSFGLKSIQEIILIDEEIKQNLQIRVGVNTGGPIVAGVLGIGKPTFEIIGPSINRAQQMEHYGVPMKVHISMDVYELICGLNFKFCNRRQIEIKNEIVETYLVEP